MIKKLVIVVLIIVVLYSLDVELAVTVVNTAKSSWNRLLDFMLTFKDSYPLVYIIGLPIAMLYLMTTIRKGT